MIVPCRVVFFYSKKSWSSTLPKFNMVHLKMAPWNRRFRTWKPSFLGSMLNLGTVSGPPFFPSSWRKQSFHPKGLALSDGQRGFLADVMLILVFSAVLLGCPYRLSREKEGCFFDDFVTSTFLEQGL